MICVNGTWYADAANVDWSDLKIKTSIKDIFTLVLYSSYVILKEKVILCMSSFIFM